MKKILFCFCGILMLQTVMAQNPNFSGTWKINLEKSNFGNVPAFVVPIEIKAIQKSDSLYLSYINVNSKNEQSKAPAQYALNGTPNERLVNDELKLVGLIKWSDDNKSLVKSQEYINSANPAQPFKVVNEVWTLSNDGKLLRIDQNVDFDDATGYFVKAIYNKN